MRPFDGFVFVVAEYDHSITDALKNALNQAYVEWVRNWPLRWARPEA